MNEYLPYIFFTLMALLWLCRDNIDGFISRKKVCNPVDKRCYEVSNKYNPIKDVEASKKLASVNKFSIEFIRYLRKKFLWNKTSNPYRKKIVQRLLTNYNPDNLRENVPVGSTNTSFVENKGDTFAVCLRNPQLNGKKFVDVHILQFVVIHELAHLACEGYGHGREFWTNFKILLQEAEIAKMYKSIDYSKKPTNYCSLIVNYNPIFDDNIIAF